MKRSPGARRASPRQACGAGRSLDGDGDGVREGGEGVLAGAEPTGRPSPPQRRRVCRPQSRTSVGLSRPTEAEHRAVWPVHGGGPSAPVGTVRLAPLRHLPDIDPAEVEVVSAGREASLSRTGRLVEAGDSTKVALAGCCRAASQSDGPYRRSWRDAMLFANSGGVATCPPCACLGTTILYRCGVWIKIRQARERLRRAVAEALSPTRWRTPRFRDQQE